jgi:hypothetical protein
MSANGGITKGKSHKEGGIPMTVKSTGQQVELEGGEGVINKRNMASTKKYNFEGKEMTICEIASAINSKDGQGVKIDCSGVTGTKYKYNDGGQIVKSENEHDNCLMEILAMLNRRKKVSGFFIYDRQLVVTFDSELYIEDVEYFNSILPSIENCKTITDSEFRLGYGEGYKSLLLDLRTTNFNEKYLYDDGGYIDLFEDYENTPSEVRAIIEDYDVDELDDAQLIEMKDRLNEIGYTFTYYLDREPYGLRPIGVPLNKLKGYEEFNTGGSVKEGEKHEMEHAETINKFKRDDISTEKVAEMIAKDHIEENRHYYSELKAMEKLHKKGFHADDIYRIINEHETNLRRKDNKRKYKYGGTLTRKEPVHIILKSNFTPQLYDMRSGEYSGDAIIRENELSHFYLLEQDGNSYTLNYPMTDYYFVVPKSLVELKGGSRRFDNGGAISQYQGLADKLSQNDLDILEVLRVSDITQLTHKDKEFISSFRGDNLVNNLPISYLYQLFGLCFKHHNIQFPIKNFLIKNIGTGNLLSIAPTYVENTYIEFADTYYKQIEQKINLAQNSGNIKHFTGDYSKINAVINVYPHIDPTREILMDLLGEAKIEMIICGMAEFSSFEKLQHFDSLIRSSNFAKNSYKYNIDEGITESGRHCLIYLVTSY